MRVDEVLQDLKDVGAVGVPYKAPSTPVVRVAEVTVEQGPPQAPLVDLRGEYVVRAIDETLQYIDGMARELVGMRGALERLKEVWTVEASTMESVTVDTPMEQPELPEESVSAPKVPAPKAIGEDAYARAREAALRKIRGGGVDHNLPLEEEDDNIPFVGQVRALPPGQEPEEFTVGTLGKIKPSFPVEEKNGA